ncbi:MAG: hypothetical protein KJ066_16235 [Acidobacteria bacterium]|nr:hypothetical protein [Acidobacteriota bacterium]
MGEPALRADVLRALRDAGVLLEERADGQLVLARHGGDASQNVQVVSLKPTVSRKMLSRLSRLYGISMAAFYESAGPTH